MRCPVKKNPIKLTVLIVMLLGLPLSGIVLVGKPISMFLEFPPKTLYVEKASFSWVVFIVYSLFISGSISPFVWQILKKPGRGYNEPCLGRCPWWGYLGLLLGIAAWILAWSRFPWFEKFQPHTFTPLWLSYILSANALTHRRTGHCPMVDQPLSFLILFPLSAAFWWFFEYLNRFVQNWRYVGVELSPPEYFIYATLSFSTVLPAFISTRQWLLSFSWFEERIQGFPPFHTPHPRMLAALTLLAAGMGLLFLGVLPNYFFSLLWVSPLLILISLQALMREKHLCSAIAYGDWRAILGSALAALVCGFFWEMWNYYSLAKWMYRVPFVQRFQIFEMPLLGYAGYLPFGAQCAVIVDMVFRKEKRPGLSRTVAG